jgi:hypothetical protein
VESGVVLPRRTEAPDSLDTNGVLTFPLVDEAGARAFVARLRGCTNVWFQENFALMLAHPPESMFRSAKGEVYADVVRARAEWAALGDDAQAKYRQRIDMRKDEGMQSVFDADFLAAQRWFQEMPGRKFYRKAVSYVRMGNVGLGLANMAGSWSAKGFGMWAHIVPDIGLPMVAEAMRQMERLGLSPGMPEHFPHPIYKPPGGEALEIHNDQIAPRELLTHLRAHVASTDPSTTAWVRKHGVQMLAHLQGGTNIHDGATFVVGPMTPVKLLVCLEAYAAGKVGGAYGAWLARPRGKIDLPWEDHLLDFNALLARRGLGRIGLVPAAPSRHQGAFGVAFPVGWPHGSFSNARKEDQAAAKGSRITITLPVTMRGSTQTPDPRIPSRLRALAALATGGLAPERYAAAEAWLARDVRPYADGLTHKNPQKVGNLIRHPDAGGRPGPYHPIAAQVDTVEVYLHVLDRVAAGRSPRSRSPRGRSPRDRSPRRGGGSDNDDPDDDVPFATLLARQGVYVRPRDVRPRGRSPRRDGGSDNDDPDDDVPFATLLARQGVDARPGGAHSPPSASILDADVRIVKVRQPWATALVSGQKDVENRTWALTPSTGFPAWVLIAASKVTPTAADLNEYRARLARHNGGAPGARADEYVTGHIVGLVRLKGVYAPGELPWPSVWHNPPDLAWVVDDALEFEVPVRLDDDDGMQTQARLATRPQYRERVAAEIRKLRAGLR